MDLNFTYLVNYDYEGYSDCGANGCDSICRCYTIERAWVSNVDAQYIESSIYRDLTGNLSKAEQRESNINSLLSNMDMDIRRYYVNRLLKIYRVWDKEAYTVYWEHDYYGDAVQSVKLDNQSKLQEDLSLINSDPEDLIVYLLEKEYGYLLDKLKGKSWKLDIVNISDIVFPQKEHYYKVNNKSESGLINYYSDNDYNLPRGVVLKDGNKYRVIDGYHRLNSTKLDVAEVIVAY